MSWKKLLAVGVFTYFIFLISHFPASVLYSWFWKNSNPVQLVNLQGSIWSGTAAQMRTSGGMDLQQIEWHLSPWKLLLGRISVNVQIKDSRYPGHGELNVGLNQSIRLHNAVGKIPASLLNNIRGLEFLKLEGTLEYDLRDVQIDAGEIRSATGEVQLQQAKLKTPVATEIGDVQFDIQTKKSNVEIVFRDLKSSFRINGKVVLLPERRFDYSATLIPTPASDPAIVSMLRNVAVPGKGQTLQFAYNGVY